MNYDDNVSFLHYYYYNHRADPLHCISSANFEKQPPDNMRKSNFFHFIISLFDSQQRRIQVQKALFKDFYDTSLVSNIHPFH